MSAVMNEELALIPAESAPPGPAEWRAIQQQVKVIANTNFVPQVYRGKPDEIMAVVLTARELGIGPMQALKHINMVQGRPTLSAELMVALVRRAGHSISGSATDQKAVVTGRRRDSGDEITVEWTVEMARKAKLLPKDNWQAYTQSMLWARAVSQLCRMLFADCLGGVSYTPEDMGEVEVQGRVTQRRTVAPQLVATTEDRDDVIDQARDDAVDADLDRPLTQDERDELKRFCGGVPGDPDSLDGFRELVAQAYDDSGVQWDHNKRPPLGYLTVRHARFIRRHMESAPDPDEDQE